VNLKAIADAIAGAFVGVTANGESIALGPTASLPNEIAKGPALLVFHPTGSLEVGVSKRRNDHYDFPVRLLTDPLNYPQRSDALYAWADAMRDQIESHLTLGLAYVAWARPVAVRLQLDDDQWYGGGFDVVELTVRVLVQETVATVAA
jgi:hypothetical protein